MTYLAPSRHGAASRKSEPPVAILSVATAVPGHKIPQTDALARAQTVFPKLGRLDALYLNTGIETRYSCVPPKWCQETHGWSDRAEIFHREAVALLQRACEDAIASAGLAVRDIDMLVVNTITGLAIPSLDSLLINELGFRDTVQRLPIFGFGCGGGVGGLSRAVQLARSRPGAHVLFATVELSSLCARPNDESLAMFVSAALFGDGAAAVVLRCDGDGGVQFGALAAISDVGEHQWPNTQRLLGWDIAADGFAMVLAPELPSVMRRELAPAVTAFIEKCGRRLDDFSGFLFHAGGKKILEAAQESLERDQSLFAHSWSIMRDYGNMSSATVLFILKRALEAGNRGPHLLAAFGPGFSAYFMVADL